MSIDEARRLLLHDAARTAWGPDAALVLMEMLPPTGWADVATRQQLEAVEERLDHQTEQLRLQLLAFIADGQRRATQWQVGTMIALAGFITAIARVT